MQLRTMTLVSCMTIAALTHTAYGMQAQYNANATACLFRALEECLPSHFCDTAPLNEVRAALAAGANPNATNLLDGSHPLNIAANKGNVEIVQALVEAGAQLNVVTNDPYGATPLHAAATTGRTAVGEYLLQQGAQVNAVDGLGRNVAFMAQMFGYHDFSNMLSRYNAPSPAMQMGQNEVFVPLFGFVPAAQALGEELVQGLIQQLLGTQTQGVQTTATNDPQLSQALLSYNHQFDYLSLEAPCGICQDGEWDAVGVVQLPCGHRFHFACVEPWFNQGKNTCPQCRESLTIADMGNQTSGQ